MLIIELTDSTRSRSSGGFSVANPLKFAESRRLPEEPLDQRPEVPVEHRQQRLEQIHLDHRRRQIKNPEILNGEKMFKL